MFHFNPFSTHHLYLFKNVGSKTEKQSEKNYSSKMQIHENVLNNK